MTRASGETGGTSGIRAMCKMRWPAGVGLLALVLGLGAPTGGGAQVTYDQLARYILETVKAFRTAYVLLAVDHVKDSGVQPKEEWVKDVHAIPLPAQFVKVAGADIGSFEIGLIGLTPVYKSNLPKTQAEAEALEHMIANPQQKIVTFADGDQFKGLSADFAIVQSCVDCHNTHPNSPKRDFKKGDVMGALIVRIKR